MVRRLPRHELTLLLVIVAISSAIGTINPAFFSPDNLFDLLKSSVTLGILAVGTLVVLVSGGIDVSFPAIAAACMYVTCTLALQIAWLDHLALLMGGSLVLGLALGLMNGLLVHAFRLPALIVTLGTASLIRGAVLEFVGTRNITNLPASIIRFSRATLFQRPLGGGESAGLTAAFRVSRGRRRPGRLRASRHLAGPRRLCARRRPGGGRARRFQRPAHPPLGLRTHGGAGRPRRDHSRLDYSQRKSEGS